MIALAAAMRAASGLAQTSRDGAFDVRPRWPLTELTLQGAAEHPAPMAL